MKYSQLMKMVIFSIFFDKNSIFLKGMEKGKIFECQEKSNLFLRLILRYFFNISLENYQFFYVFSPETRPFQAKIFNYPSRSDFILLKRRFQCTFFCYNRPRYLEKPQYFKKYPILFKFLKKIQILINFQFF